MIAIALERFELAGPVDDASAHGGPVVAVALLDRILAMAMTDAVFGQKIVAVGIGNFTGCGSVAGIPVQHERRRLHGFENLGGLGAGGGVARGLVFQNEDDSFLLRLGGGVAQF